MNHLTNADPDLLREIREILEGTACPGCGSRKHLDFDDYDLGRDETGYQDAGKRFHCTNCGLKGDADDTKSRPRKVRH